MDLTQSFIEKAKQHPLTLVYPEGHDLRIVTAAAQVRQAGIAKPIVLGRPQEIQQMASDNNISLEGITLIDPTTSDTLDSYAEAYAKNRAMPKVAIAKKLVKKPLAFGGMMVRMGDADGMVAGVASATASVIQAASLTVGFEEGMSTPSSFFIMIVPEFAGQKDKALIFADCAVNIQPDARQLAEIGIASGMNAQALLGMEPKIAFLSFATKGSASHADADKVIEAVKFARGMRPEFQMDGELQADAAIVAKVAQKKVKESSVAGSANVLVFPDLDAGNICYKLVQYLAGAKALGPILQGFSAPVNDMSRGASVEDLVGVSAITVVQAQQKAFSMSNMSV